MRELYRATDNGIVFRKIGDKLPEMYSYKSQEWVQNTAAIDAFYEGNDTYMVTKEEAEKIIADTSKRIRT